MGHQSINYVLRFDVVAIFLLAAVIGISNAYNIMMALMVIDYRNYYKYCWLGIFISDGW